ncbi:MAG: hypothetical protein AAF573_02555 [Bacteroidota bacterium]
MKKTLILFVALFCLASCKNDKKEPTKVTPVEETETTPSTPEEVEIDDSLELPDEIADYLGEVMKGYDIVAKEDWLSEDYLNSFPAATRPRYNEDIFIEGDFNGDGLDDFATFLTDEEGNVALYAFHQTNNGYKKYRLQKEGQPEFLGAGLEVEDPGFIYGGNKELGLEYNGIIYNVYEKTGTTFYYKDGRYRKVLTDD